MFVQGSRHERIAQIAGVQRGRINRQQLLAAALTQGQIRTLATSGQLRRRRHGVCAVGHEAEMPWTAETEALLACGEGAVLSHGSAGALWGLIPPPPLDGPVCVTAPSRHQLPRIVTHRNALLPQDVRIRAGLPVTSPARTLLDLAGTLTPRRLEFAFDQALIHRLMRANDMRDLLRRNAPPARASAAAGCG